MRGRAVGAVGLASFLLVAPAGATISIQVINTTPVGATPLLAAPVSGDFTPSFLVAADGDPTLPWYIQVKSPFVTGKDTVTRVGSVGLSPTILAPGWYLPPPETHPNSAIVGMSDGYVYRVDAVTGQCLWKTYIGRTTATTINFPGCTGSVPASAIQCPNELGATRTWPSGADPADFNAPSPTAAQVQIYVATDYDEVATGGDPDACGTTSGNRVYALNFATGAPAWVFNGNAAPATPYAVDANPRYNVAAVVGTPWEDFWDSCAPASRGQILVGTVDPGTGQDTLFAISVVPATAGKLNWSTQAGDVQTAPLQAWWGDPKTCGHLYVTAADSGELETFGITSGACGAANVPCLISSLTVFPDAPQLGDMERLFDPTNALFGKIVVADATTLRVISDSGPSTSLYCSASTLSSAFPVLTSEAIALERSAWVGAMDRDGNGALVGLEFPTAPPQAPFDCGGKLVSAALTGTVGPTIYSDVDPITGDRALYTAATTDTQSSAVIVTVPTTE